MIYGIMYMTSDNKRMYCTSTRYASFSDDINEMAALAQFSTAERELKRQIKNNNIPIDCKAYVIKTERVPYDYVSVTLEKREPGFTIEYIDKNNKELYYSGNKNSNDIRNSSWNTKLNCTIFKTEKLAQKKLDAYIEKLKEVVEYSKKYDNYTYHYHNNQLQLLLASAKIVKIEE